MRLLLDTHAFVWSIVAPDYLSAAARRALEAGENEILVSAACAYEVEYKRERDAVLRAMPGDLSLAVLGQGFVWAEITPDEALEAGRLPKIHGDPWDRTILAQAKLRGAAVVTKDRRMVAYGVPTLW